MTPHQFVALVSALEAGCVGMMVTLELAGERTDDPEMKRILAGVAGSAMSVAHQATMVREEIQKQVTTGNHDRQGAAPCQHPEDERIPMAVMGHPHRFQCNVCKEVVD